jgi:anthranilate phosphoribosyltransferase
MTAKPKYIPISACYAQIADLLLALKAKGATPDQLRLALARAMREAE